MAKLIDANVILRYLLNDVEEMAQKAEKVISDGAFTLPEVLAEVVYVLQGVYHVPKIEISEILQAFLGEISIENTAVFVKALRIYADKNIDFVDAILISRSDILGDEIFSFDKKLNRIITQSEEFL